MTDNNQENIIVGFLYVMEGARFGEIIKLYEGRNTIGTSDECSIQFDDPEISAKHASLRFEDDVYRLRDLDSKNGTYVNGEEVVLRELAENEVIIVGGTKLKFKML